MDAKALGIAVVFGVVLLNQVVMRTAFGEQRAVYVAMQAANAALALWIAVLGFPGMEHAPMFRGALVLVFVFRLVWNHHQRQEAFAEERRDALNAERERLLAQIHDDTKDA